jgi:predicted Zn-dependent protease
MKRLAVAAMILLGAVAGFAQFGGIINKAKDKIDAAKEKTQKASDAFTPWSAKDEQDIGTAGAAKMVAMFGLVEDPKIVKYVNLVGDTVAQFASRPLPYRFGVLDTEIVGAYALPGGFIFVTRGSLSGMTNEAQLAGALGHEVTHVAERHLEKEIRSKKTSAFAMEEANSTGKTGDISALKADAFLKDMFTSGLSRDKEDAADEQGTKMAAQAGYSPMGLIQFLTAMRDAAAKPENRKMFGQMLSTHPPFDSRIARLQPIALRLGPGATLEDRFHAAISAP